MNRLVPVPIVPHGRARPVRGLCRIDGCAGTTSGGKAFCIDHISCLPYARAVALELGRRLDAEALEPSVSVALDVLCHVEQAGALTLERIRVLCEVPHTVLARAVRRLELEGRLVLGSVRTPRGRKILAYLPQRAAS